MVCPSNVVPIQWRSLHKFNGYYKPRIDIGGEIILWMVGSYAWSPNLEVLCRKMKIIWETLQGQIWRGQPDNQLMWNWLASSKWYFRVKIQTLMLGAVTFILHSKHSCPETFIKNVLPYTLKFLAKQLDNIKVGNYEVAPMEKFSGATLGIFPKNHHTWRCPVYVL